MKRLPARFSTLSPGLLLLLAGLYVLERLSNGGEYYEIVPTVLLMLILASQLLRKIGSGYVSEYLYSLGLAWSKSFGTKVVPGEALLAVLDRLKQDVEHLLRVYLDESNSARPEGQDGEDEDDFEQTSNFKTYKFKY